MNRKSLIFITVLDMICWSIVLLTLFSLMSCSFWIEPQVGTQPVGNSLVTQYQQAANAAAACLSQVEGVEIKISASDFTITQYTEAYEMFGIETLSNFLPPSSIYFTTEVLSGCQSDTETTVFLAYEFVRAYVINVQRDFGKTHPCFKQIEARQESALKIDGVLCGSVRYLKR